MIAALLLAGALQPLPDNMVLADEAAAYESMLNSVARAADASFGGAPCAAMTLEPVSREIVKIASRPDVPAVRERLKVAGCGRSSTQNLNIGRVGGAPPWRMTYGLPGETLADMQLQQSTLPPALAQAAVEAPAGCQTRRLGDIYLAARRGQVDVRSPGAATKSPAKGRFTLDLPPEAEAQRERLDVTQAWVEVWPITLCEQDRTTAVVFIPIKGQNATAHIFLPVWRQIQAHGPSARPAPAPPD